MYDSRILQRSLCSKRGPHSAPFCFKNLGAGGACGQDAFARLGHFLIEFRDILLLLYQIAITVLLLLSYYYYITIVLLLLLLLFLLLLLLLYITISILLHTVETALQNDIVWGGPSASLGSYRPFVIVIRGELPGNPNHKVYVYIYIYMYTLYIYIYIYYISICIYTYT